VQGLCQHLKTAGIAPQARVAFIAKKTPHTVFLILALLRLRAIACPLSFREPMERLPYFIDSLSASHYLDTETLPLNSSSGYADPTLSALDPATCLLTSGSSGRPKAACHTVGNHFYSALGTIEFLSLNPSSRWLLSLPLFHVGGLAILFRQFLTGGAVVLSHLPLIDALCRHRITHLSLVPTQLSRLSEEKDVAAHLCCLLLGGAPLPPLLLKEALQRGLPLYTTYGMTEMSSIITAAKYPDSEHTGKLLPYRQFQLSPRNEILVRGETLFSGYWNKDTQTPISQRDDGWFSTGDLGELTTDGNLRILGRTDRQFISGGENIHPEEIERALCCIPGITSASVLSVADPEFGQRPIAFIQDDTCMHTLDSVREALCPLIPSFKHPVRLFSYPASDTLKMSDAYLKEHLRTIIDLFRN